MDTHNPVRVVVIDRDDPRSTIETPIAELAAWHIPAVNDELRLDEAGADGYVSWTIVERWWDLTTDPPCVILAVI